MTDVKEINDKIDKLERKPAPHGDEDRTEEYATNGAEILPRTYGKKRYSKGKEETYEEANEWGLGDRRMGEVVEAQVVAQFYVDREADPRQ